MTIKNYLLLFVLSLSPIFVIYAQKMQPKEITKTNKLGTKKMISNAERLGRTKLSSKHLANRSKQKMAIKANQAARRQQQTTATKAEFADLEKQENIFIQYITGYKVAFPTNAYPLKNAPVTIVELVDKEKNTVSILNFYGKGAKALTDTSVKLEKDEDDKDKPLQLSYSIDMLTNILDFLDRSRKKVIIYDTENKTAHLSSGMLR